MVIYAGCFQQGHLIFKFKHSNTEWKWTEKNNMIKIYKNIWQKYQQTKQPVCYGPEQSRQSPFSFIFHSNCISHKAKNCKMREREFWSMCWCGRIEIRERFVSFFLDQIAFMVINPLKGISLWPSVSWQSVSVTLKKIVMNVQCKSFLYI